MNRLTYKANGVIHTTALSDEQVERKLYSAENILEELEMYLSSFDENYATLNNEDYLFANKDYSYGFSDAIRKVKLKLQELNGEKKYV